MCGMSRFDSTYSKEDRINTFKVKRRRIYYNRLSIGRCYEVRTTQEEEEEIYEHANVNIPLRLAHCLLLTSLQSDSTRAEIWQIACWMWTRASSRSSSSSVTVERLLLRVGLFLFFRGHDSTLAAAGRVTRVSGRGGHACGSTQGGGRGQRALKKTKRRLFANMPLFVVLKLTNLCGRSFYSVIQPSYNLVWRLCYYLL